MLLVLVLFALVLLFRRIRVLCPFLFRAQGENKNKHKNMDEDKGDEINKWSYLHLTWATCFLTHAIAWVNTCLTSANKRRST